MIQNDSDKIEQFVHLESRDYPILISRNWSYLFQHIDGNKKRKIVMITDDNLKRIYQTAWCNKRHNLYTYIIQSGENSKKLSVIESIYLFLKDNSIDRSDLIISFGGGVVGDIAGYVASTYLRGICLIHVPTSLLAMVDSSIGGKCGVDFAGIKNIIGNIYHPEMVFINPALLDSLPEEELKNGMAEVIVHCIIRNRWLFDFINNHLEQVLQKENDCINLILYMNCKIKARIVEEDQYEKGIRKILNFGHTIGHGIEAESGFLLSHGQCVSIGIMGAFIIARKMNLLENEADLMTVQTLLTGVGLPIQYQALEPEKILEKMGYDKKRCRNRYHFILPHRIGSVGIYEIADEKIILDTLKELKQL
jgi:3-dehydroquinate synthase